MVIFRHTTTFHIKIFYTVAFCFIWIIRIRLKQKQDQSKSKKIEIPGRIGLRNPDPVHHWHWYTPLNSSLPLSAGRRRHECEALFPLQFFSPELGFFCFIWGSGIFIENLGFCFSCQILEMYVVLLYFPFENTVVSHALCAVSSQYSWVGLGLTKLCLKSDVLQIA